MNACAVIAIGCKVNQYDAQALREALAGEGLRPAASGEDAAAVLIVACSVTEIAAAKVRKALARARRRHPQARIAVIGCLTDADRSRIEADGRADAVVPGHDLDAALRALSGAAAGGGRARRGSWPRVVGSPAGRVRAYVKVQDGCSRACGYCVVPRLRGRSRSRPPEDAVAEVRGLFEGGFPEIVITGIALETYGEDLGGPSLAGLLRRILAETDASRIRLSSLGPNALTEDLLDVLSDPRICPHLHVPLQSGDDRVLARMRRGYTAETFLDRVAAIRERLDRPSITTDAIVGFPGEDEEAFERTIALSCEAGFSKIHAFPFSARPGTAAYRLEGRIPREAIAERMKRLDALERSLAGAYAASLVGSRLPVLVESVEGRRCAGWADRYVRVRFDGPGRLRGTCAAVRAVRADGREIEGEAE